MKFDGSAPGVTETRERQISAVWWIMKDGAWHTLPQIARKVNCPMQSVSARLRDMRKKRYGSHIIEREYLYDGLWRYRLIDAATAVLEPVKNNDAATQ